MSEAEKFGLDEAKEHHEMKMRTLSVRSYGASKTIRRTFNLILEAKVRA